MGRVLTPVLDIAYEESGPADGPVAVLLHGFPYSVHAYDRVTPLLAGAGCRVIVPHLRGYGGTRFLRAETMRSGQQGALGADVLELLDGLGVREAVLAGYDWGGRGACIVAALWPERVRGLVSVGGYNIQDIAGSVTPASAEQEHRHWYQYYLHGARGVAGLQQRRGEICRLLWKLWSPGWAFSEEEFAESAAAFENPDFVDVVVQSYRHRFGYAEGDPAYDAIEAALAGMPAIAVPTIVMEGADDGVNPPKPLKPGQFTRLVREEMVAGVGHNLPQEVPEAFARAVLELV